MQREKTDGGRRGGWMALVWGAAAVLWLVPLIAMQITTEVNWGVGDFVTFGVMLIIACGLLELAVRMTANGVYRLIAAAAIAGIFLLVWAQLAVGII